MSKPKPKKRKHSLDKLFLAIGEVTVNWAFLDSLVDVCIATIHHEMGGAAIEPEIPRTAFNRKLAYLRACYKKIDKFPVLFPNLDKVIQLMDDASAHRHRLVHGIAANLGAFPDTGVAHTFRVRRRTNKEFQGERATYPMSESKVFRDHVLGLAVFMGAFAEIIRSDPVLDNEPDKSLGKLLVEIGGVFPSRKRRRNLPNKG